MTQTLPFRDTKTVVLDGSGNGSITFQPTSYGESWKVDQVAISTTATNLLLPPPLFQAYVNGLFVGGSYSGNLTNDTAFNQLLQTQEVLKFVWTGGQPGVTATATISGTKEIA